MKTILLSIIGMFSIELSAQTIPEQWLKAKELSGLVVNENEKGGKILSRSEPFRLDSFHLFIESAQSEWELTIRNLYTYSAEGLPEVLIGLGPYGNNGAWVIVTTDSILYDDEGRVIRKTHYGWTMPNGVGMLDAFGRNFYSYGPNSQVNIRQSWDESEWINNRRDEILFDANGQIIGKTYSDWKDSDWEVDGRGIYHYNAEGINDTITYQNLDGGVWENFSRRIFTYDDQGRIISHLFQYYVSGQWVDNFRFTTSYENGIQTIVGEDWVPNQWEVFSTTQSMIVDDRVIYKVTSEWNVWGFEKDSTHYYYSDLGVAINPISQLDIVSVYPNPVQDVLTLEFNANIGENSSIDIITSTGERVYTGNISSDTKEVNVNHLASGLYVAVLNIGKEMLAIKFLKL